jgi:hypothetical protein
MPIGRVERGNGYQASRFFVFGASPGPKRLVGWQAPPIPPAPAAGGSACQGFDVARIVSRVAQRLTQPVHGDADVVLELHNRAILAQLSRVKVEFKVCKADEPFGGVDCHLPRRGAKRVPL